MSITAAFKRKHGALTIDWSVIGAALLAAFLLAGVFIRTDVSTSPENSPLASKGVLPLHDGDELVAFETFELAPAGWEGGQVDNSAHGFGGVLGRFGGTGGLEAITKTFELPQDHAFAIVEFDLHAIDDWQLEELNVFINGEHVATQSFATAPDLAMRQSTHLSEDPRFISTITPRNPPPRDRGFGDAQDQTMAVQIMVRDPSTTLTVGFGSNLLPDNANAFWAVDNLRITVTDQEAD